MTTTNKTFRSDGLDNPLSPNSGSTTWAKVETMCEESAAVESYDRTGNSIVITWCDGNKSTHTEPQEAVCEIREMENS